jgi:hypothetical protein
MYALAATAASVGVLALAQPADAKVVYTPAHEIIGANGVYNLDVNQDGTVDFLIQQWNYGNWSSNNQLLADPAVGNGIAGKQYASALMAGASIGPDQNFIAGGGNGEVMLSITHFTTGGTSFGHGFWANVQNRYLGLKFQVAGETHFGWARLSVARKAFHFTALLTGYAYEDTPNTAIKAGQTAADSADSSANLNSSQNKSLGELALGSSFPTSSVPTSGFPTSNLPTSSVPTRRQP